MTEILSIKERKEKIKEEINKESIEKESYNIIYNK